MKSKYGSACPLRL